MPEKVTEKAETTGGEKEPRLRGSKEVGLPEAHQRRGREGHGRGSRWEKGWYCAAVRAQLRPRRCCCDFGRGVGLLWSGGNLGRGLLRTLPGLWWRDLGLACIREVGRRSGLLEGGGVVNVVRCWRCGVVMLLLVMGGLLCTTRDVGYNMCCGFTSHGGEEGHPGVNRTRPDQAGGGYV